MAQPAETFIELLPLLRRTFGSFSAPERQQLTERATAGGAVRGPARQIGSAPVDAARAARVLPVLHLLLGSATAQGASHGE